MNDVRPTRRTILRVTGTALVLAALVAVALVVVLGGDRGRDRVVAAPVEVDIADFAFGAGRVTVPAGAEVRWVQRDSFDHSVVADDGSFRSDSLAAGAAFTHRFDAPGTYRYHCGIHPSMTATVVVGG